ncbi:hypothetical protein IPL85_02795 [Candidatus Saccharibacteria bacterium]|nr:MAG: hypothetical protein IPL85_02795 [Candidatus Saccharibacteria bacterium]
MADVLSTKRLLIDKANTTVVIAVSLAVFLFVFSAVSTKTFISKAGYQNRVIAAKREAREQLKDDKEAVKKLRKSYNSFVSTDPNSIGGSRGGLDKKDGDNTKIVLDALPSNYDFPALATSMESLVATEGVKINSFNGTDDEIAQAANITSTNPVPIGMPFELSVSSDYGKIQGVITAFEKSIRPIELVTLDISGDREGLTMVVGARTYFQPAKSLNVTTKVVR